VRSECLDHLIVFNEANLRRVRWRPYRSLGQAIPCCEPRPFPRQACRKIVAEPVLVAQGCRADCSESLQGDPLLRSAAQCSGMCQLLQACWIWFHMTGIRLYELRSESSGNLGRDHQIISIRTLAWEIEGPPRGTSLRPWVDGPPCLAAPSGQAPEASKRARLCARGVDRESACRAIMGHTRQLKRTHFA
jgi:hypothetical protein